MKFALLVLVTAALYAAEIPASVYQIPLHFEQNKGQFPASAHYLSRGPGYTVLLEESGASLQLNDTQLRIALNRSNSHPLITSEQQLEGKVSYFHGDDPLRWTKAASTFQRVRYAAVYPGIDMVYHGRQQELEFDFEVAPGSDPRLIELQFDGVKRLRLDKNGDLILVSRNGELRQHKPEVYQMVDGERRTVGARYVLRKGKRASFDIDAYDNSRPLIIDPVLSYGTYIGGLASDTASALTVDSLGNLYITGSTSSPNFPTTNGSYNPKCGTDGNCNRAYTDAFVLKLNSTGTALIYSTFIGGSSTDAGRGIALDAANNAYVFGTTYSPDFPVVAGGLNASLRGQYFVVKLDPTGANLLYTAFPAFNSYYQPLMAPTVPASGNVYFAGTTYGGFPATSGAFQTTARGGVDSFVFALNAAGSGIAYATLLGGSGDDVINAITVDNGGAAYVAGYTYSTNFPTTRDAFQPGISSGANTDGFFVKILPDGSNIGYGTFLGGTGYDSINTIARDAAGNVYLGGSSSSPNYPVTPGALAISNIYSALSKNVNS